MPTKHIAIVATFDTKREEVFFLESLVKARGYQPVLIDVGPLSPAAAGADFSNETIADLGGRRLADLIKSGRRDQIMAAMGKGASRALLDLFKKKRLDGVIGIGGNQGTAMASMAMQSLPLGFPKLLVSTIASGNMRPYIGHKDICVMFSVADLLGGPNPVSRSILKNAAGALMGMVAQGESIPVEPAEKIIALSALGNTEAAAHRIIHQLREKGLQVITFHASGAGGSAMEELIEAGLFSGIIDLTPHELAEEVVGAGAYIPVRPGRLQAAGRTGIPQVVSLGALEYLCFGPRESIPARLRTRKTYFHNPYNANVKLSRKEMATIGQVMAERLNAAKGPTVVLVPLQGWSIYGRLGGPLYDGRGNLALLAGLKSRMNPDIDYKEIDLHINDQLFADACVETLLHLLKEN